jgi:hypothetical protein
LVESFWEEKQPGFSRAVAVPQEPSAMVASILLGLISFEI